MVEVEIADGGTTAEAEEEAQLDNAVRAGRAHPADKDEVVVRVAVPTDNAVRGADDEADEAMAPDDAHSTDECEGAQCVESGAAEEADSSAAVPLSFTNAALESSYRVRTRFGAGIGFSTSRSVSSVALPISRLRVSAVTLVESRCFLRNLRSLMLGPGDVRCAVLPTLRGGSAGRAAPPETVALR